MALSTVHPRACGELVSLPIFVRLSIGSSPRVRGTLAQLGQLALAIRFIPARAGNSNARCLDTTAPTVHPRACGELYPIAASCGTPCGSSPRVRGTLVTALATYEDMRFIPARAGNSTHPPSWTNVCSVHPRACGELIKWALHLLPRVGSSPRVRGTQHPQGTFRGYRRFIPARAGNSRPIALRVHVRTVHPRACGELASCIRSGGFTTGSSPRVRGTLPYSALGGNLWRFIPARAGNSAQAPGLPA